MVVRSVRMRGQAPRVFTGGEMGFAQSNRSPSRTRHFAPGEYTRGSPANTQTNTSDPCCVAFCLMLTAMLTVSSRATDKPAGTSETAQQFVQVVRTHHGAMGDDIWAKRGLDGFCFIKSELRSYSVGKFWGPAAAKTAAYQPPPPAADADPAARAKALRRLARRDPLSPIVSFHRQLAKAGVELVLLPVPGKVAIYPDKLDRRLAAGRRVDRHHKAFYTELRAAGVNVIDIADAMIAMRTRGTPAHCRQDTHWSPQAVRMAAGKLAGIVRKQPWYAAAPKVNVHVKPADVAVRGDIVANMLKGVALPKETLRIEVVSVAGKPIDDSDRRSPIVLMGDSHALVYHDRRLLAANAGLADLLCAELRLGSIDLLGVMGSGANAGRLALARRRDNLAGKTCVIWCLAAREFTESPAGWYDVPVIRR